MRMKSGMSRNRENSEQGLNGFAASITSQHGEDGILARMLEVIGTDKNHWCVEFGAWDGKHLSNTYQLTQHGGYSAVLIEGERRRYHDLVRNFAGRNNIVALNRWVGFEGRERLDELLAETPIPADFDLLSIDIDGNDYHVWESVVRYRPKIVAIEFNPSIPNAVEFVQPRDRQVAQGSSLRSIDRLAKSKGYQLVATTLVNGIFVDEAYFPRFGIEDNAISALHSDESHVTHLFQGFDGTLFIRGCNTLVWHGVPLRESEMQQLPAWLRRHPSQLGRWARRAMRWYRWRGRKSA
jgi:hypothetical protein